jgi:hypothetical protein
VCISASGRAAVGSAQPRRWIGGRADGIGCCHPRHPSAAAAPGRAPELCAPVSDGQTSSSPLTSRRLVGSPEKRRAVRSTAAVRGGQGCGSIRALKSRIRATPRFGWRPRDRRGLSLRGVFRADIDGLPSRRRDARGLLAAALPGRVTVPSSRPAIRPQPAGTIAAPRRQPMPSARKQPFSSVGVSRGSWDSV